MLEGYPLAHLRLAADRDDVNAFVYLEELDATGKVEEVRGPGVVGETPVIPPGQAYDYVSGCALQTSSGSMRAVLSEFFRE